MARRLRSRREMQELFRQATLPEEEAPLSAAELALARRQLAARLGLQLTDPAPGRQWNLRPLAAPPSIAPGRLTFEPEPDPTQALLILPGLPVCTEYRLELHDAAGKLRWSGPALPVSPPAFRSDAVILEIQCGRGFLSLDENKITIFGMQINSLILLTEYLLSPEFS